MKKFCGTVLGVLHLSTVLLRGAILIAFAIVVSIPSFPLMLLGSWHMMVERDNYSKFVRPYMLYHYYIFIPIYSFFLKVLFFPENRMEIFDKKDVIIPDTFEEFLKIAR